MLVLLPLSIHNFQIQIYSSVSSSTRQVFPLQIDNLRGAQHNLFIPRPNTEALKKSFRYRGAVTWNSLSAEAKQATTLNSFYSAIVH